MKKVPLFLIASVLLFTACKKNAAEKSDKPAKLSFMSADRIPNEIIPLLYNDLVKRGLTVQAENLRKEYYQTLSVRKDGNTDLLKRPYEDTEVIMGANFPDRNVANVGTVLDGDWDETGVSTTAHVQDIGDIPVDFNAMNGTAPDAHVQTNPGSTQILGTNQAKRMQKYRLSTLRYGCTDDLSITYFTQSISFSYRSYVQNNGWMSWVNSGTYSGTDDPLRIQSIQITAPDTLTFNDPAPSTQALLFVYARAHQQDFGSNGGWMNWAVEGADVGNPSQAKRVQGVQIRAYLIKI